MKLMGAGTATAFLAACAPASAPQAGESAGAQEPVTLTWWRWGSTNQSEAHDAALRSVYPELNETSTMDILVAGDGDFGVAEALRLTLASGQDIPNMVRLNRTQVAEFAMADELAQLDDAFAPYTDDLYAGALALVQVDGHYVAFPRELKSKMFFYRQDLMDEMGLSAGRHRDQERSHRGRPRLE